MRLGVLGDIHGYLPGSDRMCIDFAVNLTATLAVDAFLQVGDMCHYRSFARPVHWIYGNNDWPDVVRQVESGERPLQHLHHIKTGDVLTLSHRVDEPVTVRDYQRASFNAAVGRDWYLYNPAYHPGWQFRIGCDTGGRWVALECSRSQRSSDDSVFHPASP